MGTFRTLVTGGAGFIGSHQLVSLIQAGHDVVVVDNLSNSYRASIAAVEEITGERVEFYAFDVRDTAALSVLIAETAVDAVVHFAGMKHVGESTERPADYYDCNVGGLLSLIKAASDTGLRRMVFSSSGSVYGETSLLPIPERHEHRPSNPYSSTKSICERVLSDLCEADPSWSVVALRYFNPAGAHPSGLLGEDCLGPPSNLLPSLIEAALTGEVVWIHGDDFNTPDGTGVRDYVHVMDVADAHLRALDLIASGRQSGFDAFNIGRGEGVSVRELIAFVEQVSGRRLEVRVGPRRNGDVSALYGDTVKAETCLGLVDYRPLTEICRDAWRFRTVRPNGYSSAIPPADDQL